MAINDIEKDQILKQVLWAYYKRWQKDESTPPEKRSICYSWILNLYKEKYGTVFHQSKLRQLVNLGFLEKDETSRGGGRRYYRLNNPDEVAHLLQKWNLLVF